MPVLLTLLFYVTQSAAAAAAAMCAFVILSTEIRKQYLERNQATLVHTKGRSCVRGRRAVCLASVQKSWPLGDSPKKTKASKALKEQDEIGLPRVLWGQCTSATDQNPQRSAQFWFSEEED